MVISQLDFDALINEIWPACKAPIVGTNPIFCFDKEYNNSFSLNLFFIIFIAITNKTTLNALFKEFFSIFLQGDLNLKNGKEKNFIRISRNITIH